jgi:predicted HAD superfamily Cof-like phosphohydrolase
MNLMQRDVAAFNKAVGAVRGDTPEMCETELRARLILEEALETAEAMLGCDTAWRVIKDEVAKHDRDAGCCPEPDFVEAVDGLCDLLYVVFGAFDAFGIDATPYFQVVHEANMTKLTGPVDEHGKRGKPPGFVPPNEAIRAQLIKDGWKP